MISQVKYDIIILGGGCAGLSLAMQLASYGKSCPSTLILEQRTTYNMDRTWCFWDDGTVPFSSFVSHRWNKISISTKNEIINLDTESVSYSRLAADTFYDTALKNIKENKAITLNLGDHAKEEPSFQNGYWKVDTNKETFIGKIIIDTRSQLMPKRDNAVLWQSFLGYEITCEEPIFDPSRAILMDFLEPNFSRVSFNYVLPFSPYQALIEATVFAPEPLTSDDLTQHANAAIRKFIQQSNYKIDRTEYAVLPMGIRQQDPLVKTNYIRVGLTAGGARNSSGYAFQRIQNWALLCARSIIKHGRAIGHRRDNFIQFRMDQLFLRVIRARPEKAPDLFLSLFKNTNTQSIIRFLSDQASIRDYLCIIRALPPKPFIGQLFRLIRFYSYPRLRKL
jgi:lycopene beta-cyclase